jgi:hypothetical protein
VWKDLTKKTMLAIKKITAPADIAATGMTFVGAHFPFFILPL